MADIVDRTHHLAVQFAERLAESGKALVINDVVFNQVLVQWIAPDGNHDTFNDEVMTHVQQEGTAFFSGTTWNGQRFMRISVSDWATDESDLDRAIESLLRNADLSSAARS